MEPIARHKYFIVQREVDILEQKYIEEEREIYLYSDKIVTQYHEFPLEKIHDVSFKEFGSFGGILYLHTNHGVYSYNVKTSPQDFIEKFKNSHN